MLLLLIVHQLVFQFQFIIIIFLLSQLIYLDFVVLLLVLTILQCNNFMTLYVTTIASSFLFTQTKFFWVFPFWPFFIVRVQKIFIIVKLNIYFEDVLT
jgi:hypothetical protein